MILCFNLWARSSQEMSASAAEPCSCALAWREETSASRVARWRMILHFWPHSLLPPIPVCECRAGIWHFPLLALQTPNWSCLLKQKLIGMPRRPVCSLGTLRYLILHKVLLLLTPLSVCLWQGFKFHRSWEVSCQNFSCAHSQFASVTHNPSDLCF